MGYDCSPKVRESMDYIFGMVAHACFERDLLEYVST